MARWTCWPRAGMPRWPCSAGSGFGAPPRPTASSASLRLPICAPLPISTWPSTLASSVTMG
eukprot:5458297-Alexandrium_andersonii.AAC.1